MIYQPNENMTQHKQNLCATTDSPWNDLGFLLHYVKYIVWRWLLIIWTFWHFSQLGCPVYARQLTEFWWIPRGMSNRNSRGEHSRHIRPNRNWFCILSPNNRSHNVPFHCLISVIESWRKGPSWKCRSLFSSTWVAFWRNGAKVTNRKIFVLP